MSTPANPLVPKGKVISVDSTNGAQLPMTGRLDAITLYNLSGVTINVSFEEVSLFIPLAASASLNYDTFDLAATDVFRVVFTASATVSVNATWIEGDGIGKMWLKFINVMLGGNAKFNASQLRAMFGR